ncbi:class I SAM-dependent methyltransferase (plasmid) [Tundrisphaera lichenicola]|uniref:class I SAM-dependent methyltransferase n=1 Tax=Tundrisphaera lichenicola TaxID=2029860 RepID=UPI003EB71885
MGYEIRRTVREAGSPAPVAPQVKHRYTHLIDLFSERAPRRLIEIGVWRGDRSVQFLEKGGSLERYVGFDLFDDLTEDLAKQEKMGLCRATRFEEVRNRLMEARHGDRPTVELVVGLTDQSLPEFVKSNGPEFDFIYIDGGHSLETIRNDWTYSEKLLAPEGLAVFDDYYLNDTSRGAKPMVDELLQDDRFEVRFFPMIEDSIDNIQMTMATVSRRGGR